ncbi:hypothetical protein [Saccharothrix sp. Mg75]|uniref:hypothetical protein n=1 Tax=Saccharothrix sp. Mg75 TaxID=3445357 RepID=UPI003EEC7881
MTALLVRWHGFTAYWFPPAGRYALDDDLHAALGAPPVAGVELAADPAEVEAWNAAAHRFLTEVVEALERRDRSFRVAARLRRAAAEREFAARVAAADARYAPVRAEVEARAARAEAERAAARARAEEGARRVQREAEERFAAWRRAHAAALADPGSPVARATALNRRALAEGVAQVLAAVRGTTAALDAAGRPGLAWVTASPPDPLPGWWVVFDWRDLPGTGGLRRPPAVPVAHLWTGEWDHDLTPPGAALLTPRRDDHAVAVPGPRWWVRDVADFAESLFPTRLTHRGRHRDDNRLTLPLVEHADPAHYEPHVRAAATRAAAAFTALRPR